MFDEPTPVADLNPAIPEILVRIIATCLQKDPEKRFVSTTDLARELRALRSRTSPPAESAVSAVTTEGPALPLERPSVAVLPFVDMSPQKDQEYFCDGMAEELINALTQIPELRVVSRTSCFQFKGKVEDVRAIGKRLGVGTLLEGSVRTAGERMRVGARLTNVGDGYQLWSSQFDREMKDVFAVQDEIAESILAALRVTLIKDADAPIVPRPTGTPEAYKLYLKGRHEWNKRTEEGLARSIEFYRQAIKADPGYARAHAGLADSYVLLGIYGIRPPNDVMPKAKAEATQALEDSVDLQPGQSDATLAAVYTALGCVKAVYDWTWSDSERHFRQAIEHDPRYPTAHHWYAINCLVPQGRFDEATREIRLAQESDPLSPVIQTSLGLVHYFAGNLVEAVTELKKTLDADASFAMAHFFLGQTYLQMSRARGRPRRPRQREPPVPRLRRVPGRARPCVRRGGRDRARPPDPRRAEGEAADDRYISAALIAEVNAGLGETEEALSWLEEAKRERSPELVWIGMRPAFRRLRSDARFVELVGTIVPAAADRGDSELSRTLEGPGPG